MLKIKEYKGNNENEIIDNNINCLLCKGISEFKTDDIYMEAITKKEMQKGW